MGQGQWVETCHAFRLANIRSFVRVLPRLGEHGGIGEFHLVGHDLGVRAVVVMPRTTPSIKVEAVRALDPDTLTPRSALDALYQLRALAARTPS